MDNMTELTTLLRNAKTTWRLIQGQPVGKEELHDTVGGEEQPYLELRGSK